GTEGHSLDRGGVPQRGGKLLQRLRVPEPGPFRVHFLLGKAGRSALQELLAVRAEGHGRPGTLPPGGELPPRGGPEASPLEPGHSVNRREAEPAIGAKRRGQDLDTLVITPAGGSAEEPLCSLVQFERAFHPPSRTYCQNEFGVRAERHQDVIAVHEVWVQNG